jgi:hypothetical protein
VGQRASCPANCGLFAKTAWQNGQCTRLAGVEADAVVTARSTKVGSPVGIVVRP